MTTYNRNLNYRSNIYEIALLAEVHPLSIINSIRNNDDAVTPFLSPYFLAGVGYFSFDPEGRIPNSTTWVRLQPLSTEGQGFPTYPEREAYKLQQVNFPFGLGVKYELNRLLNVRLEAVYHYLTTDYLDDVSTSYIDPADFDSYLSPVNAKFAKELADKQLNSNPSANGIGSQRGSPGVKDSYLSVSLKLSFILGRTKR